VAATHTVTVSFVDAKTGAVFARTDIAADRLPEGFAPRTVLHLGDQDWLVETADPMRAIEFRATGRLTLTVRRLNRITPQDVLYSLPTLCDGLPDDHPNAPAAPALELAEDDWRQVEFFSASLRSVVDQQVFAVRDVVREHGVWVDDKLVGLRNIHVRRHPEVPIPYGLTFPDLITGLGINRPGYAGVRFDGHRAVAAGTFAFNYGSFALYGIAVRERVTVLGIHQPEPTKTTATALIDLMRAHQLLLVDWCAAVVIAPHEIAAYLSR
jgi:hypothetical protein